MNKSTIIFTSLALLLASYSSFAQHISDPSLVAKGAKLYSENCGRCHNPRPSTDYSKKEWSVVMPHMREKGHMTGTEALAVEAFLASTLTADVRNEQFNAAPAKQQSGEQLVTKFGCQGCHVIHGNGGSLGPNLENIVSSKGTEFVKKKLASPQFNNSASAMPQFPMTDADIEAVLKFLSQ